MLEASIFDPKITDQDIADIVFNEEQQKMEGGIPCVLVMNKVDLVTNKRKMRDLEGEINDLAKFDEVFHISCETGFGIDAIKEYLLDNAHQRNWSYDPSMVSNKSPVEWAEEALKQAVMEKYFKEIPY